MMNKFNKLYHTIMEDYDSTEGSSPSSNFCTEPTEYLYHATYKPLLDSIKEHGLGNTDITFWDDSQPGVVYLAIDPDIAQSYAETNENCDEDWLDQIVVLKIATKDLDRDKLQIDSNVRVEDDQATTFEYHGVIPFDKCEIV